MSIRRFLRRLMKMESEEAESEAPTGESEQTTVSQPVVAQPQVTSEAPATVEETAEEVTEEVEEGMPPHTRLIDRIMYILNDPAMSSTIAGPDEFTVEFLALGERFWIRKTANGPIESGIGAVSDEDVYIRISDSVVRELLSVPTFEEFVRVYLKYYRSPGERSFVKVELRKDITSLNKMG
ncbi:MAG: hypothetical protein QXQ81_03475 [Candidatus Thorarchaeota archaeon]